MIYQLIGLLGTFCVLYSYWMITEGKWNNEVKNYYFVNGTGAILLAFSLLFSFNLGSFVIEVFFLVISVRGYYKNIWLPNRRRGREA